jgi:hypothetical protein
MPTGTLAAMNPVAQSSHEETRDEQQHPAAARPAAALASAGHEADTMNETTGGPRDRGARRSWPWRVGVLAVTAGLVLLTAACGGRPSTSPSTSTGTGGALPAFVADELAFSRCVRAHGVPNYPDPLANGQLPPNTNKQQLVSNPRLASASRACSHLIPQSVVTAQNQADKREYVRFARCMRSHGLPNFPDPTTDSDGAPIFRLSSVGIDTQSPSPQVRAAALSCMSLLHLAQLPRAG